MEKNALQFHSHSLSLVDMSSVSSVQQHILAKDCMQDILEIPQD